MPSDKVIASCLPLLLPAANVQCRSDNLYAEIFARTLGAYFTPAGQSTGSTLNDGLKLISKVGLGDEDVDCS